MKKLNLLVFSFLALTFFACEEDETVLDTVDPDITISSPSNEAEFYPEDEIVLEATVTDDLGLELVQIWVTPPGGSARMVYEEDVNDFLNDETEAEISEPIGLASDGMPAAGEYIIEVQATDDQGNMAEQAITVIIMEEDAEAPVSTVEAPLVNDVYQLGDELIIDAMVEENMMLQEVMVQVMADDGSTTLYDSTFTEFEDASMFMLQDTVMIDSESSVGPYTFTITSTDMAGNEDVEEVAFDVEAGAGE